MESGDEIMCSDRYDGPFVEWVNGQDSNYPEGQYVEAVFVGHTHENHIFYDVDISSLEGDDIYDGYSEYLTSVIYFYSVVLLFV